MKRSGPLRRRSRTNSRKHERPELVLAYRDHNPDCELCGSGDGVETNHIWSGGVRLDVTSNLIRLCQVCHYQFFHTDPICGRIVCIAAKVVKDEMDWSEFAQATKPWYLAGWLEVDKTRDRSRGDRALEVLRRWVLKECGS